MLILNYTSRLLVCQPQQLLVLLILNAIPRRGVTAIALSLAYFKRGPVVDADGRIVS